MTDLSDFGVTILVMILITTKEELDNLKTLESVKLQCVYCKNEFCIKKKYYIHNLSLGGLHGSFCSRSCTGLYKTSLSSFKVNCKNCNRPLIKRLCDKNDNNNYFCNHSCKAIYFNKDKKSDLIKLICFSCKKEYTKPIYDIKKETKKNFCSNLCRIGSSYGINDKNQIVKCINCGKDCLKSIKQLNTIKYIFCNLSCRAIYGNKTYNKKTRFGINKSKNETELVNLIKSDFNNLLIKENDRELLNGLEIDIFIPDIKIAIELNGPCHYIPIFGQTELEKTQNKDIIKKSKLQTLGIHFFQINTMNLKGKRKEFLTEIYLKEIKPLILSLINKASVGGLAPT